MNTSILDDIKKMLGIEIDDKAFDSELILHINSTLSELSQLGVGDGYEIVDSNNKWSELYSDKKLNMVKNYVFMKTKMLFDPPPTGTLVSSYQEMIKKLEWRITVAVNEVNSKGG